MKYRLSGTFLLTADGLCIMILRIMKGGPKMASVYQKDKLSGIT